MPAPPTAALDRSGSLGKLLRHYRLRAGLSREALADACGLSGAAMSALEQGLRPSPYPHTLRALSAALNLSAEESAALAARVQHRARQRPQPEATTALASSPRLPTPLTRLIGRESDLDQVQHLLDRSPLVTLVGPGGIGKTRLALELGLRSARRFGDGVRFADLSPVDNPALIASTVSLAVGVQEQARASVLTALSEALRERQMLLILDNCEHLIHGCARLVHDLLSACPGLVVLATSREPLAVGGEVVWSVSPLGLPDESNAASPEAVLQHSAAQLFVERAQAAAPGFGLDVDSAPVVADIVRRLDGIPLALELAASRVRAFGVAGLAERLDDRLHLLMGGRSAPPRQQTLRATLDWSFDLLGEAERRLFTRLAPFAGRWTLADAEAVCARDGFSRKDVAHRLANLVDQSLVVADQQSGRPRYRLLETMRQYAAERLNEAGVAEAAYAAHRDHYLALAERLPAERYTIAHIDWLANEADNLRAALRWSIDRDEFDFALRLAIAMQSVWYIRGWLSEGRAWLRELVERAGSAIESSLGAGVLGGASRLAFMQGDLATATSLSERCWQLATRLGDERGMVLATTRRSVVASGKGDSEYARGLSEEALRRSRALGDVDLQVLNLYGLSVGFVRVGDLDRAAPVARECLTVAESVDHAWGISSAHRVLGLTERGSAPDARFHLEESLAWSRRLGYAQGTVYALIALGQRALRDADPPAAIAQFRNALKLAHELGDDLEIVHCLEGLAPLHDAARGVQIAAAAATMRDGLGARPFSREMEGLTGWLERARRTLGQTRFDKAYAEGRLHDPRGLVMELLAEPSAERDAPAATSTFGLTQRETEVAALVGFGMSTAAIAAELVIAEGTAKVHVARILSKLDLHSRAQLAAWAVRNGLARHGC